VLTSFEGSNPSLSVLKLLGKSSFKSVLGTLLKAHPTRKFCGMGFEQRPKLFLQFKSCLAAIISYQKIGVRASPYKGDFLHILERIENFYDRCVIIGTGGN
jgi:hypothetical protein